MVRQKVQCKVKKESIKVSVILAFSVMIFIMRQSLIHFIGNSSILIQKRLKIHNTIITTVRKTYPKGAPPKSVEIVLQRNK